MYHEDLKSIKQNMLTVISIVILLISVSLYLNNEMNIENNKLSLSVETFNTKTMSQTLVAHKMTKVTNLLSNLFYTNKQTPQVTETKTEAVNFSSSNSNGPVWYLPTEQGYITQYPSYYHTAYDITSGRGTNELIYPVANGIITGIYHDNAGAKIVTISHYVNGQYYTSQYAHMAWFSPNISVGQYITVNESIGAMGATGIATGIHLHLTVLDCNMFAENDSNCKTGNDYYNFGKRRFNEGFVGLGDLREVPYSWTSR